MADTQHQPTSAGYVTHELCMQVHQELRKQIEEWKAEVTKGYTTFQKMELFQQRQELIMQQLRESQSELHTHVKESFLLANGETLRTKVISLVKDVDELKKIPDEMRSLRENVNNMCTKMDAYFSNKKDNTRRLDSWLQVLIGVALTLFTFAGGIIASKVLGS